MTSLEQALERVAAKFSPATLASSLQAEDMVLTDAIARLRLSISIFAIDTGRLHADTLTLIAQVKDRYGIAIERIEPRGDAVADYVRFHGRDGFYASAELRHRCCEIRKVEPLARALAGKRAWISGQRRGQSASRAQLAEQEFDALHGLEKFNPLAGWSDTEVWDYLRAHDAPVNRLYTQGYRSIGCAPCTRPVLPGEDVRAGRWWWEDDGKKECGLHVAPEGARARAVAAGP